MVHFTQKKRHLSAYSHCHYLGLMVGSKLLTFLLPIDAFVTILKRPDFTLNLLKYEFKRDGFFAWFHFDKKKFGFNGSRQQNHSKRRAYIL